MCNFKLHSFLGWILIMLIILLANQAQSDSLAVAPVDSMKQYVITTTKDVTVIGEVENINTDPLIIQTEYGVLTIPKVDVKKIKELQPESIREGKYWFPNPNKSRLFFAPTGRMLEKGEGYFADYYLFFPSASYGITNNFTLNGGFSIFPGLSLNEQIFYLAPKLGISTKGNWHFAAGGLFMHLGDWDTDEPVPTVGVLYGVTTYGNDDSGLTFGLGYGFADNKMADKPVVILGGETRVSRRISLVTENWIIPELDPAIVSYGLRFMGEKMAIDLAFITPLNSDGFFPGVPMIDFVFNF